MNFRNYDHILKQEFIASKRTKCINKHNKSASYEFGILLYFRDRLEGNYQTQMVRGITKREIEKLETCWISTK